MQKIDDICQRKITIISREQNGQLFIRISNPYAGEVQFEGEVPISESPEHGTGTKSIVAIAQKNGGVYSFTAENGIFNTTVSLKY